MPWKAIVDELGLVEVGQTLLKLDHDPCRNSECNIANLVTDAYRNEVSYMREVWFHKKNFVAGN